MSASLEEVLKAAPADRTEFATWLLRDGGWLPRLDVDMSVLPSMLLDSLVFGEREPDAQDFEVALGELSDRVAVLEAVVERIAARWGAGDG
jgi:hypothetical protein